MAFTFLVHREQINFFLACCEYVLIKSMATEAALRNFQYREERIGGLMVDRSRQANAFDSMLKLADAKANETMAAAMEEMGDSLSEFGTFIPGRRAIPTQMAMTGGLTVNRHRSSCNA